MICPECGGEGMEYTDTGDALDMCYACGGIGEISDDDDDFGEAEREWDELLNGGEHAGDEA